MRPITMEEWRLVQLFKKQNPEPEFPEPIPPLEFYQNDDYSWDELEPRYTAEGPFFEWKLDAAEELGRVSIDDPRIQYSPQRQALMIDEDGRASRDFSKGEAVCWLFYAGVSQLSKSKGGEMIGITEVFQLIVEGTNIFTLNKEEDIRIKIDRLADTISKAVILGYERSCIDAERHIEGGIDPASRVKGFKRDMDLILETVKGRADNE